MVIIAFTINGSQLDFPCWIDLLTEFHAVKISTYIELKKDVTGTETLNFVNNVCMSGFFSSFYIANGNPSEIKIIRVAPKPKEFKFSNGDRDLGVLRIIYDID
jgi:hypothetical protein